MMELANRPDFLELRDLQITPAEAIVFLNIISRIDYKELLVGEVQVLNNVTKQLERIKDER